MGVDYGSKLAGTTAAAMLVQGRLQVWQTQRGEDADAWLLNLAAEMSPKMIFIDAPLSLPSVYTSGTGLADADYFYRECDRTLHAMSPMFLGGLTARAIKLKAQLTSAAISVMETYPSQLARLLFPHLGTYKKGAGPTPDFREALHLCIQTHLERPVENWHQLDAVLAWYSGYRYVNGQAAVYGNTIEGQIII